MWDERRSLWVAMVGANGYGETGTERRLCLIESQDLVDWSDQIVPFKMRLDEGDGSIYDHHTMFFYPYGNQYLGLFDRYHKPSYIVANQLVTSRDGQHWNRPPDNREFLPTGALEDFDGYWVLNAFSRPIPVGDKLYFYYQGGRFRHGDGGPMRMCMGLATLRRDGFCGLMCNDKHRGGPGIVMTEPIEVTGPNLQLNVENLAGDGVKVGVLDGHDPHFPSIDGLQREDCIPVTDSGIRVPVHWNDAADLSRLVGRKVVLLFEFNEAILFAYRFSQQA